MDYKEEYFKMFEALGDIKVELERTYKIVNEIHSEVVESFLANNDSKEDARRFSGVYYTEGRR